MLAMTMAQLLPISLPLGPRDAPRLFGLLEKGLLLLRSDVRSKVASVKMFVYLPRTH